MSVFDVIANVMRADPTVRYALVSGSSARGTAHSSSDLDVAIDGASRLDALALSERAAPGA